MLNKKDILERYMQLKKIESDAKEERYEIENFLMEEYGNRFKDKQSITVNEDCFKITLKKNLKYRVIGEIPNGVVVYKEVVDEAQLKKHKDENWVEEYENKPSLNVVKTL